MPRQLGKTSVAKALRLSLRPLVALALRHGFKLMDVFELLKVIYVEVAREELARSGDRASASRVSVMTGVHRKDIARIAETQEPVRSAEDIVSKIIGQWNTSARYSTKAGVPRVLSAQGVDSEFAELVRSVSNDVAPYTVLYELERSGRVERSPAGLRLLVQIHVPDAKDHDSAFQMLGEDTADLVRAVEENTLLRPAMPNLHLKTEFTSIQSKHLASIREWLLVEGSKFHRRVESFLKQYDADASSLRMKKDEPTARVAFGSFSVVDVTQKQAV